MPGLLTSSFAEGKIELAFLEESAEPGVPSAERDAQIAAVAEHLASFIAGARSSLDFAVYDFRLDGEAGDRIVGEIRKCAEAGVTVRIAHDPTTSPAAPLPGGDVTVVTKGGMGKPPGAEVFLARLSGVATIKPVTGFRALMHNKYVIRDGPSE